MRIAIVNQSGGLYGVERMLLGLVPALHEVGVHVTFIALCDEYSPGAQLGHLLARRGADVRFISVGRFVSLRSVTRVAATLRACEAQVVHAHGYKAAMAVRLATLLAPGVVCATAHSESAAAADMRAALWAETVLYRRFERVVAVSHGVKSDLLRRGVSPERVVVVPNGIPDRFENRPMTRDPSRVVVVGRLVAVKRVDAAIRAVACVRQRGRSCTLYVVGDGPMRGELQSLAHSLGVAEHVHFAGFVDDVTPILAEATVFVMPSASEGAPIALLEAMASGCAIIASRVGGIPGIVQEDQDGLLVDPNNDGELEDSLHRLLDDEGLRTRLMTSARQRFLRDFEVGGMARRYLDVYRALPVRG